jgi:hypothetical protein
MNGPQSFNYLVDQGGFLLRTFHNEYQRNRVGRETEFWRGSLACWRGMLHELFPKNAEAVLSRVRQSTGLPIPHRGPLSEDGTGYMGFDSGAEF